MSVITEQGTKPGRHASDEPRRVVPRAPTAKVTGRGPSFFLPGEEGGSVEVERVYAALRETVRAETSLSPRARRIFSISCRLKGRDCSVEVGQALPSGGGCVLAIIDVGGDQPYYVRMVGDVPPLRLGKRVYSITEFRSQ